MFITALFVRVQGGNNPNIHQLDGRISKMWYIQTLEYYSAINSAEVLIHDTTLKTLG